MMTRISLYKFWLALTGLCLLLPHGSAWADADKIKQTMEEQFQQSRSMLLGTKQIKQVIRDQRRTERAIRNDPPKLLSRSITVSLRPGAPIPKLNIVPGHVTTISIFDSTGQPWPIEADPPTGNDDFFQVERPQVPPGNTLTASAMTDYANTNLVAILKNQSIPLNVQLVTVDPEGDKWETDSTIFIQIDQRGPNAAMPVVGEPLGSTVTPTMQAFIDGIPPVDAIKLQISMNIPGLDVWLYSNRFYVRTINPLQWPHIYNVSPGAGGQLKVYETQIGSSLMVVYNGETRSVGVSEPEYF